MSINLKELKQIRKHSKITQSEMAEYLGVSVSTYSKWELGKKMMDLDKLVLTADLFCVSLDLLVGRAHLETISILNNISYPEISTLTVMLGGTATARRRLDEILSYRVQQPEREREEILAREHELLIRKKFRDSFIKEKK